MRIRRGGRLNRKNIVVSRPENALNKGKSPNFDTTIKCEKSFETSPNFYDKNNSFEIKNCSKINQNIRKSNYINITLFGSKCNKQTQENENNTTKIKNKTKLLALIFSLFFIFSTLLASGVFLIVNYVNKGNALTSYISIGDIVDSSDKSKISSSIYSTLTSKLGTKTGTVGTLDGGTPIVFTMAGRNWQVVYRDPNNSDIITVWMTDYYTTAVFNSTTSSGNNYNGSNIQTTVKSYFNTQANTYPVLNNITVSPNAMSNSYKTAQDKEYTPSGWSYGSSTSTLSSYSDKFWLPSAYEAFSFWGLDDTDRSMSAGYCWLRSGNSRYSTYAMIVNSSGSASDNSVSGRIGVRPAAHLSLSAMKATFFSTVTLDKQGGSGGTSSVTVSSGSAMPSITIPTRTGYTFSGYYTGTNGSGTQYYTSSGASAQSWNLSGDTTLYAKWTANTYYVEYNGNGATSGSMSNSTYTYDTAKVLTTNAYSRTEYKFLGWSTSSTAISATYTDGQSVSNLTSTSGATVMLYAVWQINSYTISIVSNNTDYGTILNSGGTIDYGTIYTAGALPKTNCAFLYWIDSTNPTVPIYDNPLTITVTADKTYTAYFTDSLAKGISVTSTIGGSAEILGDDYDNLADTDTVTLVARIKITGYQFDGWYIQGETTAFATDFSVRVAYGSIKDKIIVARFSKISSKINTDTDNTNDFY